MKTIDNPKEAVSTWNGLLENAEEHVFKAEVLQDYTGVDDGPSLQAWLSGNKEQAKLLAQELMRPWIEQRMQSNTTITPVRITEKPYIPYLEWEIECLYSVFEKTKTETIYLLPVEELDGVVLPESDLWVFDNNAALQFTFDGTQNATAGAIVIEESEIQPYLLLRDTLIALATNANH